jgi:hypothetical protein
MRRLSLVSLAAVVLLAGSASAQAPGKFPPDSLVNTKVIPHATPVTEVLGIMRNFTSDLGVRCNFCHVGKEGAPIASYDFASDDKRTKQVARQMMLMLAEVNRRVDTLPGRKSPGLVATCATCHRGVSRPVPLYTLVGDVASVSGADSAIHRIMRCAIGTTGATRTTSASRRSTPPRSGSRAPASSTRRSRCSS